MNDLQVHILILEVFDLRHLGHGVQGGQMLLSLAESDGRFSCIAFFNQVTGK